MVKRVAIIGGGVTGLTLAYFMDEAKEYEITLFEKDKRLGGQVDTLNVNYQGKTYPIDSIVFLFFPKEYKHFTAWLKLLNIKTSRVDPRHSLWDQVKGRCVYTTPYMTDLWKTSVANLPYLLAMGALVVEIRKDLLAGTLHDSTTFEEFLKSKWYVTKEFKDDVLYPFMHVNFYSKDRETIGNMPAGITCKMVLNTAEDVKEAYKLTNGNHEYIDKVVERIHNVSLKVGEGVVSVEKKHEHGTWNVTTDKQSYEFDIVIFATWPKDVEKVLKRNEFTSKILDVLTPIPHACVKTTVHSDTSLMPHDKRLWGTYNFQFAPFYKKTNATLWSGQLDKVNIFNDYQWRDTREEMEREDNIQIRNVHHVSYHWRTPPTNELIRAREEIQQMQGTHNLYFGGAYQFNQTFHEDALTSAFIIVDKLYPSSARLQELREEVDKLYKRTVWSIYYVGIEYIFVPLYLLFAKVMMMLSSMFCATKDFLGFNYRA